MNDKLAMGDAPVVIVGGGSAGAATALTLARRGIRSVVLEASPTIQRKIGETLPPTIWPLLQTMGLSPFIREPNHLRCYGNKFVWGKEDVQDKPFIHNPYGHGWHIDRLQFESHLYQLTQLQGISWQFGCRVLKATRTSCHYWQLLVADRNQRYSVSTPFLVDATGKASRLAQGLGIQRDFYDRLTGLSCVFPLNPEHRIEHYTYIEAVEKGWWYAAPLPNNQLITVFLTDADLLDKRMLSMGNYLHALKNTLFLSSLVPKTQHTFSDLKVLVRSASSSRLQQLLGEGWLAVGDAAITYDPISSYGLISAIGGGYYAGNAIADYLNNQTEALPAYGFVTEQAYEHYSDMLRQQYQLEHRWTEQPFWQRRR
jgi:flavin-dependent dehydrogenase